MIDIYLDDLRDVPEGFEVARTYEEVVELVEKNKVGIISLDHDLGSDEYGNILKTGYDFVKWLCENYVDMGLDVNEIYIHTDNSVGRDNMYETLLGAQRRGFICKNIKIYRYGKYKNVYSSY